jgi:Single-strand binding protein family
MAADNHTIVGNLVEDPEVRFTNNGIAVTNLRVAVTQRVQQDGQWRDGDTSFFKVNVWRGQAEHLADSLSKGDRGRRSICSAPGSKTGQTSHASHEPLWSYPHAPVVDR